MKKIIPFNNVLSFNTDVKEITAISLENKINKESDTISGLFNITGEYKIIEGNLETESFSFELPFDIALGCNYNLDTLVVDIDDFRYELIERNKLKVNIDLYIDGEIIEVQEENKEEEVSEVKNETQEENRKEAKRDNEVTEPILTKIQERLDLLDEMLQNKEEKNNEEEKTYEAINEEEKYVTYRVYTVTSNDTLDKIMKKYNITKEELAKYNKIDDINPGIKLIIPYHKENND